VIAVADEPKIKIDDPRYVKALAHPMRIRILAMLREGQASPVQLAERLDETLGSVAYHVRTLSNLGLIDLVDTRQRRGATEHFYRAHEAPLFSDAAWAGLSVVGKQRMLSAMLGQLGEYINGSAATGGFDRSDANVSRLSLKADEKGWKDLAKATKKWLAEVDKIEGQIKKRTADTPEHELLDVGLVLLLFEALPFSERSAGKPARGAGARTGAKKAAARSGATTA
jgi:DNA-binding transcriptional ArsR family regulator